VPCKGLALAVARPEARQLTAAGLVDRHGDDPSSRADLQRLPRPAPEADGIEVGAGAGAALLTGAAAIESRDQLRCGPVGPGPGLSGWGRTQTGEAGPPTSGLLIAAVGWWHPCCRIS